MGFAAAQPILRAIVHDFIYAAQLEHLKLLDGWIVEALSHQTAMKSAYTEPDTQKPRLFVVVFSASRA
jgi:hypothetical protein